MLIKNVSCHFNHFSLLSSHAPSERAIGIMLRTKRSNALSKQSHAKRLCTQQTLKDLSHPQNRFPDDNFTVSMILPYLNDKDALQSLLVSCKA